MRRVGIHLLVVTSYLGLALIYLRPFASHISRTIPRASQNDVLLHGWILNWTARQLLRAPWALFDSNNFFPQRDALSYTEHFLPEALPVAPLFALTADPVLTYNVAFLLTFVLSGWGMFLLCRRLTGDALAAWVAGAFCCYFPAKRWNLAHINSISLHVVPFAMLSLHRLLDKPGLGRALVAGILVALASLVSAYYTVYYPLLLLPAVPLIWWAGGCRVTGRRIAYLLAAAATAALVAIPVLSPYLGRWAGGEAVRSYDLQVAGAIDVAELFHLDSHLWAPLLLPDNLDPLTSPFFPGLVACFLFLAAIFWPRPGTELRAAFAGAADSVSRISALVGGYLLLAAAAILTASQLARNFRNGLADIPGPPFPWIHGAALTAVGLTLLIIAQQRRFPVLLRNALARIEAAPRMVLAYALITAAALLIAVGPRLKFFGYQGPTLPYHWVYAWVPGATALRAPYRAALLATVFFAVLVGFGAALVLDQVRARARSRAARPAAALLLVGLFVVEFLAPPLPMDALPRPASGVYGWLADQPGDFGILEWPLPDSLSQTAKGQWFSTRHWKRRVTGHNGQAPGDVFELFDLSLRPLDPPFWELLVARFPVRYVLVHQDDFHPEVRAWVADEALPRLDTWLELERDFGSDLLYRVRNGGEAGILERRFADWMVDGTLVISLAHPAPAGAPPWRLIVAIDEQPFANVEVGGDVSEVRVPVPEDLDLRGPVWLRLEALAGPGPLAIERIRFEARDGNIYP